MRALGLAFLLALASCGPPELPHTSKSDPIWPLNEGKWTYGVNVLTTPPEPPKPVALIGQQPVAP